MTRDETIALFMECEAKRAEARAAALAERKDELTAHKDEWIAREAAKAHWNAWAEALLIERRVMEAENRWAAGAEDWNARAKADFSLCLFLNRTSEEKEAELKAAIEKRASEVKRDVQLISVEGPDTCLEGFVFPGDVSFEGAAFSKIARIDDATFAGRASFNSVTFSSYAGFYGATFSGSTLFDHATFLDKVSFDRTAFSHYTSFESATFFGDARFFDANFSGAVGFDVARFSSDAFFERAAFGEVSLDRAIFDGTVRFDHANFSGWNRFTGTTFSGAYASFSSVIFRGV